MTDKEFVLDKDLYSLYSERQEWASEKEPREPEAEPEDDETEENDEK